MMSYYKMFYCHNLTEFISINFDFTECGPIIRHFDNIYYLHQKKIAFYRKKIYDYFGFQLIQGFTESILATGEEQNYEEDFKYYLYLIEDLKLLEKYKCLRPYARFYCGLNNLYDEEIFNEIELKCKLKVEEILTENDNFCITDTTFVDLLVIAYKSKNFHNFSVLAKLIKKKEFKNLLINCEYFLRSLKKINEEYLLELGKYLHLNTVLKFENSKFLLTKIINFTAKQKLLLFKNGYHYLFQNYYLRKKYCEKFKITQIPLFRYELKSYYNFSAFSPVNKMILLLCLKRRGIKLCKWLCIEICKYL